MNKLAKGEKISIDGKLDEAAWKAATTTGPFVDVGTGNPNTSFPVNGSAKLAWDDANLYVGFEVEIGKERGEGLVAIYKDSPVFDVVAIDAAGQNRPEWAAAFRQRPLRVHPMSLEGHDRVAWSAMVRRLGTRLDESRRLHAVAAIVVRPR